MVTQRKKSQCRSFKKKRKKQRTRKNTKKRSYNRRKNTKNTKRRVVRRSIHTPLAPRKGKKMIGGSWKRKYNAFGTLKKELAEGEYGEVYLVEPVELDTGGIQWGGSGEWLSETCWQHLEKTSLGIPAEYILKVQLAEKDDLERPFREIIILTHLTAIRNPFSPAMFLRPAILGDEIIIGMEVCEMVLADFQKTAIRDPKATIEMVAMGILRGLDFLHKQCIIHRDIKPANIGVNPQKIKTAHGVKILDFGVATIHTESRKLEYLGELDIIPDAQERNKLKDAEVSCNAYTRWWRPPEVCLIYGKEIIHKYGYQAKDWLENNGWCCKKLPSQLKMYGYKADIWAAGCCIAELFMKSSLYLLPAPTEKSQTLLCINLSLHIEEDGVQYLTEGKETQDRIFGDDVVKMAVEAREERPGRQRDGKIKSLYEFIGKDIKNEYKHGWADEFLSKHVAPLLKFNPEKRLSAEEALQEYGYPLYKSAIRPGGKDVFSEKMLDLLCWDCREFNRETKYDKRESIPWNIRKLNEDLNELIKTESHALSVLDEGNLERELAMTEEMRNRVKAAGALVALGNATDLGCPCPEEYPICTPWWHLWAGGWCYKRDNGKVYPNKKEHKGKCGVEFNCTRDYDPLLVPEDERVEQGRMDAVSNEDPAPVVGQLHESLESHAPRLMEDQPPVYPVAPKLVDVSVDT
jgi:serine/threonine protein kinase